MQRADAAEFQAALNHFVLASGYLIAIELDAEGIIQDYNKGFRIGVHPVGEVRGQPLSTVLRAEDGAALEVVAGLPDGQPVPHRLRTLSGREVLVHAYPLADAGMLLLGAVTNPDESLAVERMAGLTAEMGTLVRELGRANRRITELSRTDALTGLANRRYFMERLSGAISHAERHQRALSVLMIDLDHFKQVNDRFGHAGGDAVLEATSAQLRRDARASDLPARLGGEEFALLLPDTTCKQASLVAERFRTSMAGLRPLGGEQAVTASVGVAERHDGEDGDAVLAHADEALYAAKAAGRNRVVAAGKAAKEN